MVAASVGRDAGTMTTAERLAEDWTGVSVKMRSQDALWFGPKHLEENRACN